MAEAVRIRTLISSKPPTIPELERFIDKRVELSLIEDDHGETVLRPQPRGALAPSPESLKRPTIFDAANAWARS